MGNAMLLPIIAPKLFKKYIVLLLRDVNGLHNGETESGNEG